MTVERMTMTTTVRSVTVERMTTTVREALRRGRTARAARCVLVAVVAVASLGLASAVEAQSMDRAGVERAALDYLEGFYEGSTEKLRHSVHPEVVKVGFAMQDGSYHQDPMSFEQMLSYATSVHDSGRFPPASAPKSVEILDVLDQTAVAKVYAWWGSDYLSMARYEGAWKIVQVLWQSPPPA